MRGQVSFVPRPTYELHPAVLANHAVLGVLQLEVLVVRAAFAEGDIAVGTAVDAFALAMLGLHVPLPNLPIVESLRALGAAIRHARLLGASVFLLGLHIREDLAAPPTGDFVLLVFGTHVP